MASPINTSQLTGSSLDVASIVSQLMEVERKPLNTIVSKIDRAGVKISALGTFQSKLSALKDAVDQLQTPSNFKTYNVSSSNTALVSAQATDAAVAGTYAVQVTQLASNAVLNLSAAGPLKTYTFSVGGAAAFDVTAPAVSGSFDSKAYHEALRDTLNADVRLKDKFVAVAVEMGNGNWGLSLQGLATGSDSNIVLMGGTDLDDEAIGGATIQAVNFRAAQNANFKLNGLDYIRNSNAVEVSGVQLELKGLGSANVEVRQTAVNGRDAVETLANAYNELLAEYKGLTSANVEASLRGVFNSDSSLAAIIRQVNTQLLGSIKYGSSGSLSGLGALGLEFADNGQLVYKPSLIADSTRLETALGQGIVLGSSTTNNLSTQLADTLAFGGVLYERIQSEKNLQTDLSKRKATVEEKMLKMEERYTAQYAALDALLFRLNSTNTALKSALDALAAQNKRD